MGEEQLAARVEEEWIVEGGGRERRGMGGGRKRGPTSGGGLATNLFD